jgi:hypothetical protein
MPPPPPPPAVAAVGGKGDRVGKDNLSHGWGGMMDGWSVGGWDELMGGKGSMGKGFAPWAGGKGGNSGRRFDAWGGEYIDGGYLDFMGTFWPCAHI